jgi:hypothetical protein
VNPIYKPDVMNFANAVCKSGEVDVKIAVVGRDKNILNYQQTRIRTEPTLNIFMEQLQQIPDPTFLSYELLYLYGSDYLRSLNLNIPVAHNDPRIADILSDDPNAKYVHNVEHNELDAGNKTGITFKIKP